jgi:transposase-like protein
VTRSTASERSTLPYISIKAKWHYLYRAVDKQGKTVDFLLRRDRGIAAAQAFFRKALASNAPRVPRKVTLAYNERAAAIYSSGSNTLAR